MSKKNHQVQLNTEEVKQFLTHIINNNRYLQSQGKLPAAVEVIGDSGLGKTSTILQLSKELGINYVKLNLAQIEELGDLVGFPVRQFQLCKEGETEGKISKKVKVKRLVPVEKEVPVTVNKSVNRQVMVDGKLVMKEVTMPVTQMVKQVVQEEQEVEVDEVSVNKSVNETECIWVDENAVEEYIKRGYSFTGEKRMSYCPPEWIAGKEEGGILLLDDWTRADLRFIQAAMEIVDRQEYISWKLPKDWHIILTSNPDNGDYLVQSIDSAQRTRFISIKLKFDEQVWASWAEKEKIDSRCINFLLLNKEIVKADTNPRSITTFFNAISSIQDFDKDLPLIQMIGDGSVGPEFSIMFTSFIHNKLDKLVNPDELMLDKDEAKVIDKLRSCIGVGNKYRADIASVMATRLINFALNYAESKSISDDINKRLIKLTTGENIFTNDLTYHIVKKLLNGNRQKFQKLMADENVMKMALA